MKLTSTHMLDIQTLADVKQYIFAHRAYFGAPPSAIALHQRHYVSIAREAGLSQFQARCTNFNLSLFETPIVRLP